MGRTKRVALAELLCDVVERREDDIPVLLDLEARPRVAGRAAALALAVDNLIDNAVRASPRDGRVQVRLAARGRSAIIEIVDQGLGVPTATRARLFEPFGCGEGLGLAASRVIAEHHGGLLELHAPPTTFRLTLPAA